MAGHVNTLLIEGTFEELCDELAAYLDGLNNAQSQTTTLQSEIQTLLSSEKKEEALEKLVNASATLNSAPEREFLAAYNLVIHLIHQSSQSNRYLSTICENVSKPITSSPPNSTAMSLGVLTTIFNTLAPTESARYNVLEAILRVINSNSTFDSLRPQLENLDSWLLNWQIPPAQQRKLFLAISDVASQAQGEESVVQQHLLKALRTMQSPSEISSEEAKNLSLRALKAALNNASTYDFQDLTALDSIQGLRKSEPLWFELLEIFSFKTLDDYRDFLSSSGPLASLGAGLDEAVLERKMRLLTLASLCASAAQSTREVSYDQISSWLALSDEEQSVEMWIIDVIRAGLVEGKMSQSTRTLLVHRATYRRFDERQWRVVAGRLDQWRDSLVEVLRVVRQEKEQFIRDKEQELREAEQAAGNARGMGGYRPTRSYRNAVEVE